MEMTCGMVNCEEIQVGRDAFVIQYFIIIKSLELDIQSSAFDTSKRENGWF
jgi:hypothetical protein